MSNPNQSFGTRVIGDIMADPKPIKTLDSALENIIAGKVSWFTYLVSEGDKTPGEAWAIINCRSTFGPETMKKLAKRCNVVLIKAAKLNLAWAQKELDEIKPRATAATSDLASLAK